MQFSSILLFNITLIIVFRQSHLNEKNTADIVDCVWWLRGKDLNQRPPGYEPDELPTALPRDILNFGVVPVTGLEPVRYSRITGF